MSKYFGVGGNISSFGRIFSGPEKYKRKSGGGDVSLFSTWWRATMESNNAMSETQSKLSTTPAFEVTPRTCRKPRLRGIWPDEYELTELVLDDFHNTIIMRYDVLSEDELAMYLDQAKEAPRVFGKTIYGQRKPRKEIAYTPSGKTYQYSGIAHKTAKVPDHVATVSEIILDDLNDAHPNLKPHDWKLDTCNDILYNDECERGGSIGRHSDDENDWFAVGILSLGQERVIRIRSKENGKFTNIFLPHNSVMWMIGHDFQDAYTHEIPKLLPDEPVYPRLSLNIRYLGDN